MEINKVIKSAKTTVREIINKSKVNHDVVVARYTAAFAVNFTDWIGKTIPWVRHEMARCVLVENLRCESVEDHVGMLLGFANHSLSLPGENDYAYIYEPVWEIRKLFKYPETAGLSGLSLLCSLENISEIFIPDLAERARECGCRDFTYTNAHGVADIKHSKALLKAVYAESTMGYQDSNALIIDAASCSLSLVRRIYT